MNFLKPNMPQSNFNWDDIDVGNNDLDHSEHFFHRAHTKHERLEDVEAFEEIDKINNKLASAGIDDVATTNDDHDKENEKPAGAPAQHTSPTKVKGDAVKAPHLDEAAASPSPLDETAPVAPKIVPQLATQWSTQKPKKTMATTKLTGKPGAMDPPPTPHAYKFKDVYQQKKEDAMRRRAEEERKKREFHPKPAPNFSAYHQRLEQRPVQHKVTTAVTPQVLKKSRETEEKRRKRLEEWKRNNPPPKFECRPPDVLKEEPFVPKKAPTVLEQRPFTLHSEQRAQQRKQFNQEAHEALLKKRKQVEIEEEEKRKRDEERIKELRKMATFKARPNPFK